MSFEPWYRGGETVQVDGFHAFFRREGSGPALVCIHGFPTSSWDFEPMWASLTGRFDVLASDLIGLGRSSKPDTPLSVHLQASIIEAIAVRQGLTEAHLLAHDLGDTVAQELLARQRDGSSRVQWRSCVFLNGGLFPETHRPRLTQQLLTSPLGPLVAQLSSERTFRRTMGRVCSPQHPPSEAFLAGSWALLVENGGRRAIPRLIRYMEERRTYRERWVRPLMESTVPMRLINGALDPVSGRHAADRYRELVPEADIVMLDELGHYPHVERPARVLEPFHEFHDRERARG